MSTSVSFVSIFDIALIVDSICYDLSLSDVKTCRRVNKQWSILFKPHLWSTAKLVSPPALPNDPRFDALFANKHWIRSLTLTPQQAVAVSDSGHFTTLRELALYGNDRSVSSRDHIVALINNNPHLESLTINHCCDFYTDRESRFSQAILLIIASHPSLTRLAWHVPEGHETTEFAKYLLYACHASAIQELTVVNQYHTEPCQIDNYGCFGCWWHECPPFHHDEFAPLSPSSEAVYRALMKKLEVPMDELEEPFAFRKLCLATMFDPYLLKLLSNCPNLQHMEAVMVCQNQADSTALLQMLASKQPRLRGLVLWDTHHEVEYARALTRFQGLQRLHVPSMTDSDQVNRIVDWLASSSHRVSLESLGVSRLAVTMKDVVSILATFPNLKELDVGGVRIYVRSTVGVYKPLQDKDIDSMETVVRDWDPTLMYRQQEQEPQDDMSEWWRLWSRALRWMKALRDEYHSYQQELTQTTRTSCEEQRRSISMQFMYPIRAFMNRAQLREYLQATGPQAKHARGFTLTDAYRLARGVAKREEANADYCERRHEDDNIYACVGRWNEYDARVEETQNGRRGETAQEYTITKSRNRHRSLRDRKRSSFRKPFKK